MFARHETLRGSGDLAISALFTLIDRGEWLPSRPDRVTCSIKLLLPNGGLGGPRISFGRFGEDIILLSCRETKPYLPVRGLVTIPTDLTLFRHFVIMFDTDRKVCITRNMIIACNQYNDI